MWWHPYLVFDTKHTFHCRLYSWRCWRVGLPRTANVIHRQVGYRWSPTSATLKMLHLHDCHNNVTSFETAITFYIVRGNLTSNHIKILDYVQYNNAQSYTDETKWFIHRITLSACKTPQYFHHVGIPVNDLIMFKVKDSRNPSKIFYLQGYPFIDTKLSCKQ